MILCRLPIKEHRKWPAIEIFVEFYDPETEEIITSSEHSIDYLEKGQSSKAHIHFEKKDLDNIRYKKDTEGNLSSTLMGSIYFSNFYKDE